MLDLQLPLTTTHNRYNDHSATDLLTDYKVAINQELQRYLRADALVLLAADISDFGQAALDLLTEFCLRPSKRLRGSLTALAYMYTAHNRYQAEVAIKAAAAVELIQDYLLIVDDVMDQSTTRRGGATIHQLYKRHGFDKHTAEMLAINLGVLAQHLSNLLIISLKIDQSLLVRITKILHRNIGLTGFGQLDDLNQTANNQVETTDIMRMYRLKSSYYTFINPLQIGVVLAGETRTAVLHEIEQFGLNAGVAFQLKDDLLGLFGDPLKTGKPVIDDIKEGKRTLLIDYCLKHISKPDKIYLQSKLGAGTIQPEDVQRIRQLVDNSGAHRFIDQQIKKYADSARSVMTGSQFWPVKAKGLFNNLVTFSEDRVQ